MDDRMQEIDDGWIRLEIQENLFRLKSVIWR